MKKKLHYYTAIFKTNPWRLFLIDCIGASLTACFLAGILANFPTVFGMPVEILYPLSLVAIVYALYSFGCYLFVPANWRPYLRVIIVANFLYLLLTIGVVYYFYTQLTVFGWIYFVLELLLMSGLLLLERKVLSDVTFRNL